MDVQQYKPVHGNFSEVRKVCADVMSLQRLIQTNALITQQQQEEEEEKKVGAMLPNIIQTCVTRYYR